MYTMYTKQNRRNIALVRSIIIVYTVSTTCISSETGEMLPDSMAVFLYILMAERK